VNLPFLLLAASQPVQGGGQERARPAFGRGHGVLLEQHRHAARELDALSNRLEDRVAERTRAIQLVLDSTGEAMLSCSLDGALAAECSATVRE
jgi:hypothetical protein